jgi:hypothetical protein
LAKLISLLAIFSLSINIAKAEDIDVFIGGEVNSALPNIVFVLDNTSNWARQAQKWPGGLQQGQSEARAIKSALAGMVDNVTGVPRFNVGLMEFTTAGNANQDGGFVRFDLRALTPSAYTALSGELDEIFTGVTDSLEKRESNTAYGNLMYDIYNYLGGFSPTFNGDGTAASKADAGGYTNLYSKFSSPLVNDNLCSNTYLIFIGNPDQNGPTGDSLTNSNALKALYAALGDAPDKLAGGNTGTPLPLPEFTTTIVPTTIETTTIVPAVPGTPFIPEVTLGASGACYRSNQLSTCTANENSAGRCVGKINCTCVNTVAPTSSCAKTNEKQYLVKVAAVPATPGTPETTVTTTTTIDSTVVTPVVGSFNTTAGTAWNLDDWSKFLHNYGVPVSTTNASGDAVTQRVKVTSYMIDVFNAQQSDKQTGLFLSAADVGGGKYFAAKNEDAIVAAINSALADILSVSATFSAATLPLSASNRSQSDNEVYIGMFRPYSEPRWFGNLKRYKVGLINDSAELVDIDGEPAVNNLTGFLAECAKSYWTIDKGNYWENLNLSPPPLSQCTKANIERWADSPDGPFVEKGGAAQVSRYSALGSRKVLTVSGSSLAPVTAANLGGNATLLGYLKGTTRGADENMSSGPAASAGRPSIHGDVIHSRPLPINYGGSTGTVLFYGVNDGLFRAVKGSDGSELWSLFAPEHSTKIQRLYANSPRIAFPNADTTAIPAPTPKDYFFDGSVGQLVNYATDNSVTSAYIYPTMRRGGRMIYALDVTTPGSPSLLWRRGCPNPGNATAGCDSGFEKIGQTWSTPQSANVAGYTDVGGATLPVVMFGGGYDAACLDPDAATFNCASATGRSVYVLDATNPTSLTKVFATDAPVVGDIALADVNFDGKTDFAYAADAAGSLWRINFASMDSNGALAALGKDDWSITKIASTEGDNRRFLNGPAVAVYKNSVYVSLGSGNRERQLKSNYPYQTRVEDRFYVFLDKPGTTGTGTVDLDGTFMNNTLAGSDCATAVGVYPGSTQRGWYYDLAGRGEQVINPAVIGTGKVFFNSYQPGGDSPGVCTGPRGISTGYSASIFTGACSLTKTSLVGSPPIPPTIPPPICIANCNDPLKPPTIVTVCIGCKPGLAPTPIEPTVDQTRQKIYWKTDIDL